jgi:toxin-antitoxin system PIN domain toxin
MHLPDVNIWLALAFASHKHHPSATTWFAAIGRADCAFCRLTQQAFLRLATTPRVLADAAVTLTDAWHMYDNLFSDPRVVFAEEPEGLESFWRGHTQRRSFSPKVWNDAYLAAFAQAADFEVVTFDGGFAQYKNVRCTILTDN